MRFNNRRRLASLASASAFIAALAVTIVPTAALAAAPPAPYENGFEDAEDVGTTDQAMFNVAPVATGTDGITSAAGGNHAVATAGSGAFTRFGGYSSTFPADGYTTSADIYLDTAASTGGNDVRFDWSSAINKPDGTHRRDFAFNVGTDGTGGFVMSASNNTGRANSYPNNPGRSPITITTSGWYTFKHHFQNNGSGVLTVDMSVSKLGSAPLHTWTLSDASDVIGTTVGGNRYGFLASNELPLALDNITRSGIAAPTPTCEKVETSLGSFTAAVVNPVAPFAGPLPLSGCQIGVYFNEPGSVKNADIAGATHYGVFVDGAAVNVTGSDIHQIGNTPFNGAQNGRAVFYTNGITNGATGTVSGNDIYDYQKNGVVATGVGTAVQVLNNTVTGRGHLDGIAQNGVVILSKATALVKGNSISGHWYTPTTYTSYGLLLIDAKGVKQQSNSFLDNEANLGNFGRGGGNTSS